MTRFLLLLLAGAPAVGVAQAPAGSTTLRFGIAYADGTPTGRFADVAAPPSGFSTWMALPISRTSPIGIRAEFSILTVPDQRAVLALQGGADLQFTLRSTVGFTGVGPRLETRLGPVVIAGAAMGGLTRVLVDLNGRLTTGPQVLSVSRSESENALAVKATLDLYVPLLRGGREAAIGLTGGVDWTTSKELNVYRSGTFTFEAPGQLVVAEERAPATLYGWRVGVGVFF